MRWRDRTILAAVIAVVMLSLVGGATADPYEVARTAYNRGDYASAYRLFQPLAEQGSASAQYTLGSIYNDRLDHLGIAPDYAEAARWYRRAAEQGDAIAQFKLGYMYINGFGIAQDYVEAHKWLNIAAANGHTKAATLRNYIERELITASQITEARQLARAWQPKQQVTATHTYPLSDVEAARDNRRRIARIQRRLASLGYDPGPAFGVLGRRTRTAIRQFRDREGLPVTGTISDDLEAARRRANRAVATAPSPAPRPLTKTSTGSGFYVSKQGHILTNEHVVGGCVEVQIAPSMAATVVARDQASDLALLKGRTGKVWAIAAFRQGRGIHPGDDIVVIGYPLPGLLASEANVTTGTVSALAGPGDDRRLFQISAPVQPGNSGGPVLDTTGSIVGVVMAKLNAIKIARATGDIPQNVNFAIGASTARAFLDAQSVSYWLARSTDELKTADIAAEARRFTVLVECWN